MGGKLALKSAVGEGSTFHFTLAFKAAPPVNDNATAVASVRPLYKGVTVLVAEDIPLNQEVVGEMLGNCGIAVIIAGNGAEALTQMKNHADIDLVFMDCQMPVMDGLTAARAIRKGDRNQRVTIIALTAGASSYTKDQCLEAGMTDYLSKPFRQEDLESKLRQWLPEDKLVKQEIPFKQEGSSSNAQPINARPVNAQPVNVQPIKTQETPRMPRQKRRI